jgi:phage-related protein
MNKILKEIIWLGRTKKDLKLMPEDIIDSVGFSLYLAQIGERADNTKVLKGYTGAGVLEIIESDISGTYRAVYTVKFGSEIYVLHCFQKKSKSGIATPKEDMSIINKRLKEAEELAKVIAKEKS